MQQEEYNEIECFYCRDTPDYNIFQCLICDKMFCADHIADFDICINCTDPDLFEENMENR